MVAVLGFGIWLAIDKSLFGDAEQQVPPQTETGIPSSTPSPAPETPKAMSSEEAFDTTSDDSSDGKLQISCETAGEKIGIIYDMHIEGKSADEISQYLAGLDSLNQAEIEIFSQIAESVKNAPSDELLPREEMIKEFELQCEESNK